MLDSRNPRSGLSAMHRRANKAAKATAAVALKRTPSPTKRTATTAVAINPHSPTKIKRKSLSGSSSASWLKTDRKPQSHGHGHPSIPYSNLGPIYNPRGTHSTRRVERGRQPYRQVSPSPASRMGRGRDLKYNQASPATPGYGYGYGYGYSHAGYGQGQGRMTGGYLEEEDGGVPLNLNLTAEDLEGFLSQSESDDSFYDETMDEREARIRSKPFYNGTPPPESLRRMPIKERIYSTGRAASEVREGFDYDMAYLFGSVEKYMDKVDQLEYRMKQQLKARSWSLERNIDWKWET